jgi:hypothetical protein
VHCAPTNTFCNPTRAPCTSTKTFCSTARSLCYATRPWCSTARAFAHITRSVIHFPSPFCPGSRGSAIMPGDAHFTAYHRVTTCRYRPPLQLPRTGHNPA